MPGNGSTAPRNRRAGSRENQEVKARCPSPFSLQQVRRGCEARLRMEALVAIVLRSDREGSEALPNIRSEQEA